MYDHNKEKLFNSWGYTIDDSKWLQNEIEKQALQKYIETNGLAQPNMAVVIQSFVEPEYAGVWIGKTGSSGVLEYVKGKGKMTIGYTVYAPMNYTDENGEFVGFDTEFAIAVCEKLMVEENSPVMGLHLEGPYLNPKRASDQFGDKLAEPDAAAYTELVESTDCIKRWDASPELPGALDFARYLKSKGIVATISHTEAEYQEVKDAFEAGFTHVSHFYNGMPGFHKNREYKYEGTVESVYLIDDITIELIADGRHLPDTILKLAYKVKGAEKTCLVTASLAYAGVDAKEVDDPSILIEDGVCKSRETKQLVGSVATMDVLVQNMVKAGVPLEDVLRMASETPAKIMGVYDKKGSLEKDKDADILILDKKLRIRSVWSKGQLIEGI